MSSWCEWFAACRRFILLVDELPHLSFEELSALMLYFGICVLAGDKNQFVAEHRQTEAGPKMKKRARKERPQPLNRQNGDVWVQSLAKDAPDNVEIISGFFQYRYGHETIRFLKHVFPDQFSELQCPLSFRKTVVIPYIYLTISRSMRIGNSLSRRRYRGAAQYFL
jgi:hypothetical protein